MNVTPAFHAAMLGSHQARTIVEVLDPDTGDPVVELDVISGSVTVDRSAAVRRRCQLVVVPGDLIPVDDAVGLEGLTTYGAPGETYGGYGDRYGPSPRAVTSGLLTPYGTEIRVRRGIEHADGTVELVGVGVFGVASVQVEDTDRGVTMKLAGYDRSKRVSQARWTNAYVIPRLTNYATAIQQLISSRYPDAQFDFMTTTRATPLLVLGESTQNDPWKDAQNLAATIGADLFVNGDGVFVLAPLPDLSEAEETWTVRDGATGTIIDVTRSLSADPGYNGVVVTGENPDLDVPVRAEAWDDNPASPTFRGGPYGERPKFLTSQYITDTAMAQDAANRELRRIIGQDETVTATIPPHPALDAGDVVRVQRAASNLDAVFTLERYTLPLAPSDAMPVTFQRIRSMT